MYDLTMQLDKGGAETALEGFSSPASTLHTIPVFPAPGRGAVDTILYVFRMTHQGPDSNPVYWCWQSAPLPIELQIP